MGSRPPDSGVDFWDVGSGTSISLPISGYSGRSRQPQELTSNRKRKSNDVVDVGLARMNVYSPGYGERGDMLDHPMLLHQQHEIIIRIVDPGQKAAHQAQALLAGHHRGR